MHLYCCTVLRCRSGRTRVLFAELCGRTIVKYALIVVRFRVAIIVVERTKGDCILIRVEGGKGECQGSFRNRTAWQE